MKFSDKIPIDDLKSMDNPSGMFKNYDCEPLFYFPPPDTTESLVELKYLKKLKSDECLVNHYDDILSVFMNKFKWDDKIERLIKQLLNDSSKILLNIKWFYNRLRPYQLAEKNNIELNDIRLHSMNSPSYPSGHAAQAYLVANYMSNRYPILKTDLLRLAKNIANSRLVAKCHYPSDKEFGKLIGEHMADHLINYKSLEDKSNHPYIEFSNDKYTVRKFSNKTPENLLKWHTDAEDRTVIPLKENDWLFQYDDQLPHLMNKNIFIREGHYHRVIKGESDLLIKVFKHKNK